MNGNRATCRLGNLYAGLPITGKSSMVRLVALLSCAGVGLVLSLQASPTQGVVVGWGDNSFGQCSVPADLRSVVSVAAGYDHALALRADGTVVGWGQTWFNAATPPPGLSNIIAIAAGTQSSVALRSDGTAVTWGRYGSISGLTGLQAISSGYSHTVGLRSNGTIIAWGDNSRGQTAVPAGLTNVLAVAAGTYHSLAIKHDGTVVGWGRNDYGQCNPPPDLTNAVAVAGGNYHSMALRSDGTVVCWGTNWAFGDIANQNIAPPGLSNVVAITAGAYHNLAIRADGSLVAWGWAGYGVNTVPDSLSGVVGCSAALSYNLAVTTKPFITAQPADVSAHLGAPASFAVSCVGNQPFAYQWELGGTNLPGATNAQLNLPSVRGSDAGEFRVVVSNSGGSTTSHVAQLEILLSPSAIICPDSALVLLGGKVQYDAQAYGQNPLSLRWQFNGADLPSAASPSLILSNILASQAGAYTLAVTNGLGSVISPPASLTVLNPAQVLAWGQYWSGELNVPSGLSGVVALAAGRDHVLALRRNGTVAAWGMNYMGQLDVPPGLSNVVAISAGQEYSLALRQDGTLAEWGGFGPDVVPPAGLTNVAAVAGGQDHGVALLRTGTVVTWGTIASAPAGLSGVMAVEASNGFCLALRTNGVIIAWGDNSSGQCNVPAGLTNAVSLASGYNHSLALKQDGTVVGWGANDHSQTDVPPSATNVIAIAAGYMHSMALRSDGTLVTWGDNQLGESPRWIGLTGVRAIAAGKLDSVSVAALDFPEMLRPAADVQATLDSDAVFTVSVLDNSPLTYQWQFSGTNLPGATSSTLTLSHVQPAQEGDYTVTAVNAFGNSCSAQAHLTVVSPPSVLTLPAQGTNNLVAFSGTVNPNGSSTAAWFEWGTSPAYGNATRPHPLDAATTGVQVTTALDQLTPGIAYHYRLVATNIAGTSSTRDTIYQAPRISLRGPNPLTNECHVPFADPGASSMAQPLAIAAGLDYSLALNYGHSPVAWGFGWGATGVPTDLTDVVAIAAGAEHGLALRSNGMVVGWGADALGSTISPPGLSNVVAIAAGDKYSLALRGNGTVVAWGFDYQGDVDVPSGLTNVVAIAAGSFHALALKRDGTVAAWGYNADGQTAVPANLTNVLAIAAGWNHSLALRRDGTVFGWGQTSVPVGLSNIVAIAAGNFYSLALKNDATVVGWGFDYYGEVSGATNLVNVTAIAAGAYHALAVQASGTLVAWGDNVYGETNLPSDFAGSIRVTGTVNANTPGSYSLTYTATNSLGGTGSAARTVVVVDTAPPTLALRGENPLLVPVNTSFTDPGATASDACAGDLTSQITVSGTVDTSTIGTSTLTYLVADPSGNQTVTNRTVITTVNSPFVTTLPPTQANGTEFLHAAVNPNGSETVAWFEWGTNILHGNATAPRTVGSGLTNVPFRAVLTGLTPGLTYHYRVAATNSAGHSAGRDVTFRLPSSTVQLPPIVLRGPNPLTNECHSPFQEPGAFLLAPLTGVAAGQYYSMALKSEGTVGVWGNAPVPPSDLADVAAVVAGYIHCLALKTNGTVVGWGDDSFGETDVPLGLSNVVAVSAGWGFSLALQSDGTVVGWGLGATTPISYDGLNFAQAKVPSGLGNVVAISAGFDSSLALKSDGTVASWGYPQPYFGWLWPYFAGAVPPADLSNVIAIATGADFGVALKSDGTVVGWGYNGEGQVSVPDGLSNVVSVAAGFYHSLALKADGTVTAWGDNFYGEATPPAGLSNVVAISAGAYHSLALRADGSVVGWGLGSYGETDVTTAGTNLVIFVPAVGAVDTNTPGTYFLTYTATNSLGSVSTAPRTVVVVDTTPPAITCPPNLTVEFTNEAGATVFFAPEAFDLCSASVAVTCLPPSGSLFPIGTTHVLCTAADVSGNTNTCVFPVTVLDAQGVKSNVLSQLVALRNTSRRSGDRQPLADAIVHLRASLDPRFWVNGTHLDRRWGAGDFQEEQAAALALTALLNDHRPSNPDDTLVRGLIARILKVDRLLAAVAIQDAACAGVSAPKLSLARQSLLRGDQAAARFQPTAAIEHYRDSWNLATRLSLRLVAHPTKGGLRLEFLAVPGERFAIETSTNLTDWTIAATASAGTDGIVRFEGPSDRNSTVRFYRARLFP